MPEKKNTTETKKKKKKRKTQSTDEEDRPIPPELRLPPPGDNPNNNETTQPKKKKKKKTKRTDEEDRPIPAELKLPPPVNNPNPDQTGTSFPPQPSPLENPNRDPESRPLANPNRDPNNPLLPVPDPKTDDVICDPNSQHETITHLLPPGELVNEIRKKDGRIRYVLNRPDDPDEIIPELVPNHPDALDEIVPDPPPVTLPVQYRIPLMMNLQLLVHPFHPFCWIINQFQI